MEITYKIDVARGNAIAEHLRDCSNNFTPPLESRLSIKEYSDKIKKYANTFEAWHNGRLVGLVAVYFNDLVKKRGFITDVSVVSEYVNKGIGTELLRRAIEYGSNHGFVEILLEVNLNSHAAISMYKKVGFVIIDRSDRETVWLRKALD